ncbi:MAG: efflux RND transporter permease subunit, partial [Lentisphaerae bacterium]|nr:efflux RND transporter permease subunit [Lentisphaerota bacterium]
MIDFFVRHPTAANLLMVIFLVLGVIGLPRLRRETFPDITPREVEVRILYPGATAEEAEEAVCQRVEDAIDGVKFVKEVRSDAREGVGTITVEMESGGTFADFRSDIDSEVAKISDFPAVADDPIITQLGTTDLAIALLVSGPMPPAHLKAYCEGLKDDLQALPEVSLVKVRGFSDHQFRIELSAEQLQSYGLSAAQVADVVARQSVSAPAGAIETREQDILLRLVDERRTTSELAEVIIRGEPGAGEVRLGDIARIVDVFEVDEDNVLLGRHRAGLLHIEKTKNQDVIRVADAVKAFVQAERERNPTVELVISRDGSTLVVDRLQMLIKNGWQGMLLVFLTLWLFFNLRLSFWVAMSLPVSFAGAFFFMPLLGLTVNMMTMVGMLLALGLLMDDGIVIAENIASHLALGKGAMEAAVCGVNEVKAGVFSSFLTTICILGPLVTIGGDIGAVLKVIPVILILVMSVSLVEAFAILPAHLGHALHGADPKQAGRFRRAFDAGIEWTRETLFGRTLDVLLAWRYLWLGAVLGLFFVSLGLVAGGIIKFQAFPDLDGDVLSARLLLPAGTPLERTETVVLGITDALDRVNAAMASKEPDGRDLVRSVAVEFN